MYQLCMQIPVQISISDFSNLMSGGLIYRYILLHTITKGQYDSCSSGAEMWRVHYVVQRNFIIKVAKTKGNTLLHSYWHISFPSPCCRQPLIWEIQVNGTLLTMQRLLFVSTVGNQEVFLNCLGVQLVNLSTHLQSMSFLLDKV